MIRFDRTDMQRFAVSAIGALSLTAASVIAAAGPVKAATADTPMSVEKWQGKVERRIETIAEPATVYEPRQVAVSQVAVVFTADGDFAGARIAQSSGDRFVDARALNVARGVRYPSMPEGYRGIPTMVRMTLYFGPDAEAAAARDSKKAEQNIQLAAL